MTRRDPTATDAERRLVRREVRSDDPSLSDKANQRLTDELRQAVGGDTVAMPADSQDPATTERASEDRARAPVGTGPLIGITFAAAVTVGVAVSLVTGSWWAVVAASAVHAVGTIAVLALACSLTARPEHVTPSAAAELEEEGVGDPDRHFSDLVDEYGPARGAHARRLTQGQEQPSLAWRGYVMLGAGAVTAAATATIVAGLAFGWF